MPVWALQDAKAKFSQLVRRAQSEGPQTISVRGEPAVVMLSVETYRRLQPNRRSFVEIVRSGPDTQLDLHREQTTDRDIEW
ncbi:MAG: type II toxin-antitoxin system Phd/YefM family antitoxin [Acidithiobacillus caldus]|jgi:antitoxin Phd|uniref:Antitoxin n=1 Tax=Acidithiobacillus caldus TaxID=33059 RepID=A0A1E7Z404_9PROT|nr:type II toxin-antitoxin system Phd/YefM family antitoxin [Acidithiobacillus caldus]MBU2802791.1 type II toxin-antitoxin system Phd/YefM family antitoxin [Acidithiobacillus caldus]OFC63517.1 hypothetical protein BAE30_00405 [Acidithiobacillus caldus]WMT47928.1 MAG: type II toxin-antitoxin system Phd/YefM family antitoxin [Acidithiobacillus caldus]